MLGDDHHCSFESLILWTIYVKCLYTCIVIICKGWLYIVISWLFIYSLDQVVLELQDNGNLSTSDDPPVVFGYLDGAYIEQVCLLLTLK